MTLSLTPVNSILESDGLVKICIVKTGISNENINILLYTVENHQAKSKNLKLEVEYGNFTNIFVIAYKSQDSSDFREINLVLQIGPEDKVLCHNIVIVNDDIPEPVEVFAVALRLLAPLVGARINTSTVFLTIIDDDHTGNGEVCMIWQPYAYRQVMAVEKFM